MMNKDFLMGFVSGTVVGAVGYRLYEQNQGQLSQLIQNPGMMNAQQPSANTFQQVQSQDISVEDLISQKERLEDMIAEKKVHSN
ncbi:hypothetical protein IMZ31_05715 [Pontibacillus sp. ALD_SL1]|uniref:hypothetical protein n=1 Tax=Pontibacillus sp. ALD_SL1 TaxID=2777185 RepID=UPI001A96A3CC|nr:hypothetical protein [Pontibacillus sp. ALD_SL1]QST01063.1 hypothetical protein IMZ31_05715 [Pontibacillus sp. ALD_SL1]